MLAERRRQRPHLDARVGSGKVRFRRSQENGISREREHDGGVV